MSTDTKNLVLLCIFALELPQPDTSFIGIKGIRGLLQSNAIEKRVCMNDRYQFRDPAYGLLDILLKEADYFGKYLSNW